jgi:dihydrofolate reductase
MTKVLAGITTSVDGYVAGPNDGPGKGLGEGGERLHYWVFGGPWTYDAESRGEATGEDAAWLEEVSSTIGAVVGGRWTYEAAGHWGDKNPWGLPFFIVTHRPEDEPAGGAFSFVNGVEEAVERARDAAAGKDVHVMGGADVIRQALPAGAGRRADDRRRPGGPRRRQAPLRRLRAVARARAPRRAPVAPRDVRHVRRQRLIVGRATSCRFRQAPFVYTDEFRRFGASK